MTFVLWRRHAYAKAPRRTFPAYLRARCASALYLLPLRCLTFYAATFSGLAAAFRRAARGHCCPAMIYGIFLAWGNIMGGRAWWGGATMPACLPHPYSTALLPHTPQHLWLGVTVDYPVPLVMTPALAPCLPGLRIPPVTFALF